MTFFHMKFLILFFLCIKISAEAWEKLDSKSEQKDNVVYCKDHSRTKFLFVGEDPISEFVMIAYCNTVTPVDRNMNLEIHSCLYGDMFGIKPTIHFFDSDHVFLFSYSIKKAGSVHKSIKFTDLKLIYYFEWSFE